MLTVTPDMHALTEAFERESRRIIERVRGFGDLTSPVPSLSWTAGQLIAHVASEYHLFGQAMREEPADPEIERIVARTVAGGHNTLPAILAAVNEREVARLAPANPRAAADMLAEYAMGTAEAMAAVRDPTREVPTPWYGPGVTRTAGTVASLAVAESSVHDWDLARAERTRVAMSRTSAAAAVPTVISAMCTLLLDERTAQRVHTTYEVRVRAGAPFSMRVADGRAECFEPGRRDVDCVISLDPCAALLIIFRRRSLARTVLTGGVLTNGRKPWLGLAFPKLFLSA